MYADLILLGNAIFDGIHDEPFEGGVAAGNGKIIFVGTKDEVLKFADSRTVIKEYNDNLIMPGLCDSHAHFAMGARFFGTEMCDLLVANSEEECVRIAKEFAEENKELEIIQGAGWDMSYWGENPKEPTKESLDREIPDRPVFLIASDGHSIWMNSKMLEIVKPEDFADEFEPEKIPRYDNGEFTGVLKEDAAFPGYAVIDKISEPHMEEYEKAFLRALTKAGITGFSDVSIIEPDDLASSYRLVKEMDNKNELNIRMYIYAGQGDWGCDRLKDVVAYNDFFNTDTLRIAGIKGVFDGVTSSYTALLTEPYADRPDTCGVQTVPYDKVEKYVIESNRLGYSVRIHCIGDLAVRYALDCYEASNKVNDNSGLHNGIEHIEIITPQDIPRFAKLGVTASMQPGHQIMDKGGKLQRCGRQRSRYEWAFRSLKDAGAKIALGTDYNAMNYLPFPNIYYALTKRDMDGTQYGETSRGEILTLPEALKAYTSEGAVLNGMENKVGILKEGMYADIIVTDRNLFEIHEDDIKDTETILTVFDGRIVYEA